MTPAVSSARADGNVDALLANPALDEDTAMVIAASGTFTESVYDQCPDYQLDYPRPVATATYQSGGLAIRVDEYYPPSHFTGQFPLMVLVHGGGWWRGCRKNMQIEASNASGMNWDWGNWVQLPQQFIVFSIDYRLACKVTDPNLGPEVSPLCGWPLHRGDAAYPDGFQYGAPVHDIENALVWARQHANDNCVVVACWNGKVEMVGSSAGGNLAYLTSGRLGPGHSVQPNALGAWSGAYELTQMQSQTGKWPCEDNTTTFDIQNCRKGENWFLDDGTNICRPLIYPDPPNCHYAEGSPYTYFVSANLPPNWFANGGGPTPGVSAPELVALQSALDFRDQLIPTWDPNRFKFCRVDEPLHSRDYLYLPHHCKYDLVHFPLWNMVDFLKTWTQ